MSRRSIAMGIFLLVCPALLLAQGTSPVKVTGISISPATISPGTNVSFTVTLQNAGTATYGCSGGVITLYVFKNQPNLSANQVFTTTQAVAPMAPAETRSVPVTLHWTVPGGDATSYHVVAWSPMCGSDEFGQQATLTLRRSCTFSATPVLIAPSVRIPRRKLP